MSFILCRVDFLADSQTSIMSECIHEPPEKLSLSRCKQPLLQAGLAVPWRASLVSRTSFEIYNLTAARSSRMLMLRTSWPERPISHHV